MYLTLFWDDRASLLKLRAVRPADGDPVKPLSDFANLLEGSTTWTDRADDLQTQIWIYYAQIDPTEKIDEPKNYAALEVVADLESETPERNGISKIKTIFSRWIAGANGGAAVELGGRILTRYSAIPREVNFLLDGKDGALWLADFVSIENRNAVDYYGNPAPVPMQITSAAETVQGSVFSYTAIEYLGASYREPDELTVILSVDDYDVNLRAAFEQFLQITPEAGMKIRFIIPAGVVIGATVTNYLAEYERLYKYVDEDDPLVIYRSYLTAFKYFPAITKRDTVSDVFYSFGLADTYNGYAVGCDVLEVPSKSSLMTGDWPAGVDITLEIEPGAKILGHGGSGGAQYVKDPSPSYYSDYFPIPPGDGGAALDITYPIKIKNSGIIGGGGGGGGLGLVNLAVVAMENGAYASWSTGQIAGGGGAGKSGGALSKVPSTLQSVSPNVEFQPLVAGAIGALEAGGVGGSGLVSGYFYSNGSAGGDLGQDGNPAGFYNTYFGKAGYAVKSGGALIEWVGGQGDIRGDINA